MATPAQIRHEREFVCNSLPVQCVCYGVQVASRCGVVRLVSRANRALKRPAVGRTSYSLVDKQAPMSASCLKNALYSCQLRITLQWKSSHQFSSVMTTIPDGKFMGQNKNMKDGFQVPAVPQTKL